MKTLLIFLTLCAGLAQAQTDQTMLNPWPSWFPKSGGVKLRLSFRLPDREVSGVLDMTRTFFVEGQGTRLAWWGDVQGAKAWESHLDVTGDTGDLLLFLNAKPDRGEAPEVLYGCLLDRQKQGQPWQGKAVYRHGDDVELRFFGDSTCQISLAKAGDQSAGFPSVVEHLLWPGWAGAGTSKLTLGQSQSWSLTPDGGTQANLDFKVPDPQVVRVWTAELGGIKTIMVRLKNGRTVGCALNDWNVDNKVMSGKGIAAAAGEQQVGFTSEPCQWQAVR